MITLSRLKQLIDDKSVIYYLKNHKISKIKLDNNCAAVYGFEMPLSLDIDFIKSSEWGIKEQLAIRQNRYVVRHIDTDKLFETKKEIKENSK